MQTATARSYGRIGELDGIRALAILAVLAVHLFANPLTQRVAGALHGAQKAAFLIVAHGWLGVDLFFVLSGFLITGILLDSRRKKTYFRDFWVRRALRILPLVFAVVAIDTIAYHPQPLYVLMALFFSVDFAQFFGLGNNGMGPLWSLAVEEQFYLVWPFLVFFVRSRTLAIITIAVIVIEPIVRIMTVAGSVDVLWYRVDGLAMGAFIALWVRSAQFSTKRTLYGSLGAVVAAGILLIADLRSHTTSLGMRITEADLAFGAAIASAVVCAGSPWLRWLRSAPARFIADTSFCAYLIHVPLIDFAKFLGIGMNTANPFVADSLQAAFVIPMTFGIAALSRTFLEVPFLKLKDRFTATTPAVPPILTEIEPVHSISTAVTSPLSTAAASQTLR